VTGIGDLPLRGPDGNYVALRQLTDIYESSGRYIVLHQGARRVQTITTCDVEGRDVISFVAKAQRRIQVLLCATWRIICRLAT
jgi:Cu/Ag efflux pump CusA